ncbi:AAA family ATPase [Bacillus badius]|uniref:Nuclease SbcCD subunit C n=1 Tax=Bacillus badius TaxID=1455 RepID=A0ABR5AQS5_BACBA|nr:AAA family ATPase [Bacillus badius]KIL73724.1 ATPase [Bacillus badius]MED4715260.1 AAA family ATPase [Bacillus badius]
MAKQLKLLSLSLKNFKGVRAFTLETSGDNVRVFGDNATGKTTVFDAFVWLLFDKDSQNKKDFSIKTLDENGQELHGLEHEVESTLLIDGQAVTLRKVYKEKWTKKRGSATSEFTGHTTDYFIDSVPVKKKEFAEKIASIIDEDIFKLLTSPSYFNEQLKWQDRRKTLLEICGDITDEEVIRNNQSLTNLPAILQGRSIEDQRKIIAAKRSDINKELEKIPVRIDEIQRSLPDVTDFNKVAIESEIDQMNSQIEEKQDLISNIRNGNAIAQKQKAVQEIEIELLQIKQQHEAGSKDEIYSLKARIQEEESNVSILNSKLENVKNSKRHNDENIKRIDEQLAQLRQEWHEVNSQEFTHNDQCECPTCGQSLPEEQVTSAREKALAQFNLTKSKKLEEITNKGKQGGERKQEFLDNNEVLTKEYEKLNGQISEKHTLIEKLKDQLTQLESVVVDITENAQYTAKLQEKQNIQQDIHELKTAADQSIQSIQLEIIELKSNRDRLQAELGKFAALSQSEDRIHELEAQERQLAAEYEDLEQQLYLTEEFIRTKVNLLEEKINSKFKYARFKLFETQINGGLTEVCKTTFSGVPYDSGLNNAAKINVGLDIINTLSQHYNFLAPIFVDNAEAVTKLIDSDSQLISLVVSEKDKQLRVETQQDVMKEAI